MATSDKVAVITGAGSGTGLALAEHCARVGMKLFWPMWKPRRSRKSKPR